ncbi:MAG TPA: glycerophosphodiester phosphodiesterase [Gaiellaceae bacterium]
MRLERRDGRPLVIGHRGAAAVAPENSREALEAAVTAGADLVEFDVGPGLVLAHDAGADGMPLGDALDLLAATPLGLHIDVKERGYEQAVLEAVDARGLRDRVLVSTAYAAVGRRVRALAPELPVAIGYPRDSYGVSRFRWPDAVVAPGRAALRGAMPLRIPLLLRAASANVLALHHTLCSRAAVAAARRAGAPVLAWTANDPERVRALAAMGVDGIVSDDPAMALAALGRPTRV